MQTATDAIDLRSVQAGLERLKAGVSATIAAENGLIKSKTEQLSALRREAMRHAEVETAKLEARIHALGESIKALQAYAEKTPFIKPAAPGATPPAGEGGNP